MSEEIQTRSSENNHEQEPNYSGELGKKIETGPEARDRLFLLIEQGVDKKMLLQTAVQEGRLQIKNTSRYNELLAKFDTIVAKYPKKNYMRDIPRKVSDELKSVCNDVQEINKKMDRLLKDMVTVEKEVSTPEQSKKEEKVLIKKNEIKISGNVERSQIWEHAKNLESKIKKLKEGAKDAGALTEIEEILTKVSEFSKKDLHPGKESITRELDGKRKLAELKLARLNTRMVHLLEKLGQSIPESFVQYKNFKPVINAERSSLPSKEEKVTDEYIETNRDIGEEHEKKVNAALSAELGFSDRELKNTTRKEDVDSEEDVNESKSLSPRTSAPRKAGLRKGAKQEYVEEKRQKRPQKQEAPVVLDTPLDEEVVDEVDQESAEEIQNVDIIQPPENFSEGALGDSEIGGVNTIVAGAAKLEESKKKETVVEIKPQEKSADSGEEIPDAIQIFSGGKTYEFGWHEQVTYTTAKGKKLDCIVLGKSKDENKPGLILKDLEKGKVFAVGADTVAERVNTLRTDEEIKLPDRYYSKEESIDKTVAGTKADVVVKESPKKGEILMKKKDGVWVHETEDEDIFGLKDQPKREEVRWPDSYYEKEESLGKMIADAKEDFRDEMKNDYTEFKERDNKKKLEEGYAREVDRLSSEINLKAQKAKYAAEQELPRVIIDSEQVPQSDEDKQEEPAVLKGDEFIEKYFPKKNTTEKTKSTSSSLPEVSAAKEEQIKNQPPLPARERKTYPEVSEKQAIKMIDSVDEALEKSWGGMRMMVTEKQKTGWFRSKQVEREMTNEERKAQLEAWLDTVEQAFDSLDKKKEGINLEKPVLAWHKAQILMRKLEIELKQMDTEMQNAELKRAFNTMNAEVVEAGVRLEEKKEKRDGRKSRIPNWARRTILGVVASLAFGSAESNRGSEVVEAAQTYSEKAPQPEGEKSETASESQTNLLNFLTEVNQMMTESALSVTPFMVDAELASEIKDGEKVPGLTGAELSRDGKSVKLTFDNQKTVVGYPEKVQKSGKQSWRLKRRDTKESAVGQGEKILSEVKQVFADFKKQYPDIAGTPSPKSRQKKNTFSLEEEIQRRIQKLEADPESYQAKQEVEEVKKMIDEAKPEVTRTEKKLRGAEAAIPRSGDARRPLEQVKKMIDEAKPEVVSVSEPIPKLAPDVLERFNREVTFDPKADALFEEWGNARNSLKAAQEAGDLEGIKKSSEELRNVIEKITKEYSE